jgi:hypothetical protein
MTLRNERTLNVGVVGRGMAGNAMVRVMLRIR